jgi:hypothetical protein
MIKLCIDCKHFLQEDDMRWCTRPIAGYDLNPVDGSKQGGPENHPSYEMAFIERQADFRCGTEGRHFVAKILNDSGWASKLRTKIIDSAVKDVREFGYPKCNAENIFTDYVYSKIFTKKLWEALEDCGGAEPYQLVIKQLLQECGAEGK